MARIDELERARQEGMSYALEEEWEAIDNELVKKLFRTPQCERVLLLSSWSDEELWETLEALQNIRNNKQKIDLINTELNARSKESGMTFQSSVKEKEFCEKWTEMQRLFGKGVNHEIRHTP